MIDCKPTARLPYQEPAVAPFLAESTAILCFSGDNDDYTIGKFVW